MHSYCGSSNTQFHYNSDFSGNVRIVQTNIYGECTEIEVPGTDLLKFVALCYVATNRIGAIEQADYKELLK